MIMVFDQIKLEIVQFVLFDFFFVIGCNQSQGVVFLVFIFNEICVMNENIRVMFFLFDFLIYGCII